MKVRLPDSNGSLARKQQGSRNWNKQKKKISGLHHTIANERSDFLQKLSTEISKSHAKGLCVRGITDQKHECIIKGNYRRTRQECDEPKSGLNKSILDQGWFEFQASA